MHFLCLFLYICLPNVVLDVLETLVLRYGAGLLVRLPLLVGRVVDLPALSFPYAGDPFPNVVGCADVES